MSGMKGRAAHAPDYRVVEISDVVDSEIEAALNRAAGEGFRFESIHFVSHPGSRRPAMAFLFFTRSAPDGATPEGPAGAGE